MFEVLARGLAKNVDEAVVKCWFFDEGDRVEAGADLVELMTEGPGLMITAPVSGILSEVYFDEGETVQRDELLCVIEEKVFVLDEDNDEGDDRENDPDEDEEDEL